jgi:homoserine kinase type II
VIQSTLTMYAADLIKEVCQYWGLTLLRTCPEIDIAGSPERCDFRVVIEDNRNKLFILENISAKIVGHKLRIIKTLDYLNSRKLPGIRPYVPVSDEELIANHQDDTYWQLVPYVEGIPLNRPEYIFERWRGNVLADFLINLRKESEEIPYFDKNQVFSTKDYVYDMRAKLDRHEPELCKKIQPIIGFLENKFMDAHDELPVCFCHGDYHPLNVIWSEKGINAVIDWEFLGFKPEAYDAANLVGCIGIENPQGLLGDFVYDLIQRLKNVGLFKDISWEHFLEFMVALRFGWLSEWLRKSDTEMIDLEVVYMNLLVNNREILRKTWQI